MAENDIYMFAIIGLLVLLAGVTYMYLNKKSCSIKKEIENYDELEPDDKKASIKKPGFVPWNANSEYCPCLKK